MKVRLGKAFLLSQDPEKMANSVVVVIVAMAMVILPFCTAKPAPTPMRLIEFNETSRIWMSQDDVEKMIFSGKWHNFIDVTDAPEPLLNNVAMLAASVFPDQPTQKTLVESLVNKIDLNIMRQNLETLSSFFTRYYTSDTGVEAAQWIYSELLAIKGSREDVSVTYFQNSFKQPSVIARIEGALPAPHSVVILGSHLDSIGTTRTGQAPGADDDGSGTVCNMEAFRVLVTANVLIGRPLEFHFYAGEEAGLLGSQAIANSYSQRKIPVYSMMQLDMTMYPGAPPVAMSPIVDFTNPDLTAFVRILIDTYCSIPWADSRCGYGCSDHASWFRTGVASVMPFETTFSKSNPAIHSPRDVIANLDFNHGRQFVILALSYLVELGQFSSP